MRRRYSWIIATTTGPQARLAYPLRRIMATSKSNSDDGMVSGINVTPLVDITLVLLIIFMVTARIIVSQSLPMDLPKPAPSQQIQLVFGVELHANGDILVD